MYSEAVTYAEETFRENRRLRVQSLDLRGQINALMLTYRAHRFPRLSGGSEPTDRAATIRAKICAGVLPRPTAAPEKCWGGKGTMRLCHGCAVAIAADKVEYELDIVGGGTLLFCGTCLTAWNALRAERIPA